MSTAVEKQLRAAQKYLTLVKTLPVFEGVREQHLQDIKEKLEQVSLNVDQAACLVDLLAETVHHGQVRRRTMFASSRKTTLGFSTTSHLPCGKAWKVWTGQMYWRSCVITLLCLA